MFSVPSPGDPESTSELLRRLEDVLDHVDRVYLGLPQGGTGRATVRAVDEADVAEVAEVCDSHGVDVEVVINPLCTVHITCDKSAFRAFEATLGALDDAGVEHLVLSDPMTVETAAEMGFHVSVSCVAHVNEPGKAERFAELGASEVTVDTAVNRRLDIVSEIADVIDVRVIVNEGCLRYCPYRLFHLCEFSHASRGDVTVEDDPYFVRCISERLDDPAEIVRSPFVRPEDLDEYEGIGVSAFKIAGRANSVAWIERAVRAYIEGGYEGNLLDVLDCPTVLRHLVYLDNSALDGALREGWSSCRGDCERCGFCSELARRAVRFLGGLKDAVGSGETGGVEA